MGGPDFAGAPLLAQTPTTSSMLAALQGDFGVSTLGAGLGVGGASVINPIYVTENAPRAIRGLLTGMYQLFIVTGGNSGIGYETVKVRVIFLLCHVV